MYSGFTAIKNNTFCVKKGEVFGLLGPNGAGKSTTFNVLSMKIRKSKGQVRLMHENLDIIDTSKGKVTMGMVAQNNTLWNLLNVD